MNLALIVAIVLPRVHESTAMAQAVARPADYMLLPGDIGGADSGVVYIIDSTNQVLSAVSFQDSSGRIEVMPAQDLSRIFAEAEAAPANPRRRR